MSYGPPINIPKVISQEEYRVNKERLEKAKRLIEMYDSMNENAWRQHREDELTRKVAEGDEARQELERLRGRNAPLTITAPPVNNDPSPMYAPTIARIEEVPSNSMLGDQRVLMQNPPPPTSNTQVQVNRPPQNPLPPPNTQAQVNQPTQNPYRSTSSSRMQVDHPVYTPYQNVQFRVYQPGQNSYPPTSGSQVQIQPVQNQPSYPQTPQTPHTFFNNSGTIQEQPDRPAASKFRYYSKAIPSQATSTHHVPANQPVNQPIVRGQVSKVTPNQQIVIPASQSDAHRPVPPARKQSVLQQPLEPARSNFQQKATTIQQPPTHRQGLPLRTIAPATSRNVRSDEQDYTNSSTSLVVAGQSPSTVVKQGTVAHAATSTSTTGQHKGDVVPTTQPSAPGQDTNAHLFKQYSSHPSFIEYLRAGYLQWFDSIRPDTYSSIPSTSLFIAKRSDNVLLLVVPDGQGGYAFLDILTLIKQPPATAQRAVLQDNAQRLEAQPALSRPTASEIGSTQTSVQPSARWAASGVGGTQASIQASAIPQQLPQSTTSEIGSTRTFVQSSAAPQSHPQMISIPHQSQETTPATSPERQKMRTPADADKRHLARDILRALGIKRPRSMGTETQTMEPASKRHRPRADRVAPQETRSTQLVVGEAPADKMQSIQSDQTAVPEQPGVNSVENAQELVEPVAGASAVDRSPTQSVSTTIIPESAQPRDPVASVVPLDEPKAAYTGTSPHASSPPIETSVTNNESVTASSTSIDISSPKLGAIEHVAPESVIESATQEETALMDVDIPLSSTHPTSYIVESPASKTLDLPKSDDATSEFDRLTIHDEIISPAVAHPDLSLRIEELEEDGGEVEMTDALDALQKGVLSQDVEEPEEESMLHDVQGVLQEREVPILQVRGASQESGEISDVREALQEPEEGEILMMSPRVKSSLGDAESVPPVLQVTLMPPAKEEDKKTSKMPLFLPSPSSSPQIDIDGSSGSSSRVPPPLANSVDEDMQDVNEATKAQKMLKSIYRRTKTGDQPFYILVPTPPPYLVRFRKEEARQRRKKRKLAALQSAAPDHRRPRNSRSASQEDVVDPVIRKALEDSTTRLTERRCKWSGCDTVMNSPQHLFKHLQRHCLPDFIKKYVLCYWTGCGDHIPNSQIDEHLATHAFTPLSCPYEDCEESFRAIQSLIKHNDLNHRDSRLKRTTQPFLPNIKEPPPPVPGEIPAYLINSGLVRQEPIERRRHLSLLGPWVYNNIAGPVRVTRKYNAAKGKPDDYKQDSSMRYSSNPSKATKIRDMGDLQSVEVSELVSDGLIIWPAPKKKATRKKDSEIGLKLLLPNTSSEEDELQDDDLFGKKDLVADQALNSEVKQVSGNSTHLDEDAVATMLIES